MNQMVWMFVRGENEILQQKFPIDAQRCLFIVDFSHKVEVKMEFSLNVN